MSHDNLGFTSSTDGVHAKNRTSQSDMSTSFTSPIRKASSQSYTQRENVNSAYVVELQDEKRHGKELEAEYDPYLQRKVEHPTTNMETLLHLLKGSLGTGILAMPNAFNNSGWAVGLVGTVIIGVICTYCIHILIKSEYELCRRRKIPSLTYPATAEAALNEGPQCFRHFARASVHVINVFLLIYQLGACCVYVVFIGTNLRSALTPYFGEVSVTWYMLAMLLPLILINWIKNLKFLAPFSTLANAITFISFGIILYYVFREEINFNSVEPIGKITNFPLFFGTVLFALEAIGVILPLENEMKTPKSFGGTVGVLNIGMVSIILLYVGMGFFGYLRYGDGILGSITLNLPDTEILAQVVQILLAFAIYITHAIQFYVAIDITWNEYLGSVLEKNSRKVLWEYAVRTGLVVLTFLLAVAIPELDLFISLFGALCLSALGIAFPAIIQTCAFWNVTYGRERWFMVAKNSALIAFGIVGLVVGTYTSLVKIIEKFT